jgi:hypothetical protein
MEVEAKFYSQTEVGVFASMAGGTHHGGLDRRRGSNDQHPKPSWIEGVYFGLGLAVFGLAERLEHGSLLKCTCSRLEPKQ